jgi:hypothetical protein
MLTVLRAVLICKHFYHEEGTLSGGWWLLVVEDTVA